MSKPPEKAAKAANGPSDAPRSGAKGGSGYRVLARKYRPATFDDLIGQDAMVRTLSNAFDSGRIAQAYMLSGVRGVGKTTTARILARALNYEPAEGGGGPTLHMPVFGRHCAAIMESRHIDVLEMDAASHTGIDDVREILDGVRYAPADARYKVYIIDEVHMLSDKAFNAFLKTLEEPPPHVKFIFATTEIRKVPVTVLSRCQRFDLRRVDAGLIVKHLAEICEKENVTVEPEVLGIIARAAEGSVRDALSLLDQAIAHGNADLKADEVRAQLGLADRARVIDLFEALMKGDIGAALANFRDLYDIGADPAVIIADLAEFTHLVTRFKLVPSAADDRSLVEAERNRGREFAEKLSVRVLSRAWQMLSKGLQEVQSAEKGAQAAEMVLVRLAFAADLPTPDEALRALEDGGSSSAAGSSGGSAGSGAGARMQMAAEGGARDECRTAARSLAAREHANRASTREVRGHRCACRSQTRPPDETCNRDVRASGQHAGGSSRDLACGRCPCRARPIALSEASGMDRKALVCDPFRGRRRADRRRTEGSDAERARTRRAQGPTGGSGSAAFPRGRDRQCPQT